MNRIVNFILDCFLVLSCIHITNLRILTYMLFSAQEFFFLKNIFRKMGLKQREKF